MKISRLGIGILWVVFLASCTDASDDSFNSYYYGTPGYMFDFPEETSGDTDWNEPSWITPQEDNGTTDDATETPCPVFSKCDCSHDCDDIADELNCSDENICGFEHSYQCGDHDGGVFLGGYCKSKKSNANDDTYYCDGYRTCADGSDEPQHVFGFKCRVNPRQSRHRPELRKRSCSVHQDFIARWKNFPMSQQCQNYSICPEDETEVCYSANSSNLNALECFQCLDGTVLRSSQVCDGKIDCEDLSDECLCSNQTVHVEKFCNVQKEYPHCGEKFVCGDDEAKNFTCVESKDFCVSSPFCPKELCPEMPEDAHKHTCIPPGEGQGEISAHLCDGRPECREFSDECSCENKPKFCSIEFTGGFMNNCTFDSSRSHENQWLWICNGVKDCETGLDEKFCDWRQRCYPDDPNRYESFDIEYEKCDFIKDCDNYEDEKACDGRFYCDDGKPPGLRNSQLNDGKLDCKNGEDECEYKEDSFSSGQSMIKNGFIIACMWIMAAVAIVGNAAVIYNCVKDLWETYRVSVRGRVGVCNKTLVLNLALADFLMGLYLLILGIKAVQYDSTYCGEWQNWRSSTICSGLGTLAMLSSQTSVLIMVMMTTYRFYSVRCPFRAEKLKARYLVAAVLVCWVPPIFLAFMPLRGHEMAFAFQSRTKLPYFESAVVEKPVFHSFLLKAWTMDNRTAESFGGSEWDDLLEKFCDLFGEVCGPDKDYLIVEKWYGYYSADSVCLPRLFPHVNDSGWDYTAGVIIFDFLAFVYILLAYTMMYICTVKRSSEPRHGTIVFGGRGSSFSSVDENRVREDRVIWQRISRLLFTDFLCWMPICITCMISLSNHDIPPLMYQISAAFFLPINSALNPLLYSNAVYQMLESCFPGGFLGCVGLNYLSPCTRNRGTRTPSTNSRVNGVVASATDELRVSRDQLSPEVPSELDRNRNITTTPEGRPLVGGHKRSGSDVLCFHTEPPPTANCPEIRSSIARSMARVSRIFSERRANNVQLSERATFPRRHRPKSQSTTSTSTTFTNCGQDP